MSASFGKSTAPGSSSTADHPTSAPSLALVIAWSRTQPERVGEVAFFPPGERLFVGRGDAELERFAHFVRQRPGETPAVDLRDGLLTGDSLSRRHLGVRFTGVAFEIEPLGRNCRTLFHGEVRERAAIGPGDTVLLEGELLLLCALRPKMIPALRAVREVQAFGEPDTDGIVGESPEAWALREQLALAARTHDHVLIRGESGTGKELAGAVIHQKSARAAGPFVARNASNFTTSLLESQLFGTVANWPNPKTPAQEGVVGAADGGTLFLDEIGDLSLEAQTMLLRVIDRGECQPVGASRPGRVDVRFVGATDHDESFRNDFVARFLARVRVPPLRERREDIPLLIRHLLLQRARREPALERFFERRPDGRLSPRLSGRLVDHLVRRPLPTNVRELEGVLVRAVNASTDAKDKLRLAPEDETSAPSRPPAAPAARVEREPRGQAPPAPGDPSKEQVVECLERERGNVARAARGLGLQRNKLYRLMESYGIERQPVD